MLNEIFARQTRGQPTPTVGMGATTLLWSDRHACTITKVLPQKDGGWMVLVQEDLARVISGSCFDGSARYDYHPNPDGAEWYFRFDARNPDKGWRKVSVNPATGRWVYGDGSVRLKIGVRDEYRDPHF